jgi:hypothetical protein
MGGGGGYPQGAGFRVYKLPSFDFILELTSERLQKWMGVGGVGIGLGWGGVGRGYSKVINHSAVCSLRP